MDAVVTAPRFMLRPYLLEAKYEFLRLLRTPSYVLPTLLFPPLFYVLFGVLLGGGRGGAEAARYLLASYGVFGIVGSALFGFGVNIAIEREQGLLTYKRALPVPPGALLVAKMVMAMAFASIISLLLAALAFTLAGVRLAPSQWALLWLINVIGTLPFCAMGLLIGTVVSGQASPAIVNIVYLPMSFLSGLWIPLTLLPGAFAQPAPIWPAYHLAQIALKVVGRDDGGSLTVHVLVLAVLTVAFFALARRRLSA